MFTEVLRAGGSLSQAYRDLARETAGEGSNDQDESITYDQPASLIVEHDDAELRYDGRNYRAIMRRRLRNNSDQPVTRYLIRISVDRYPGNPERSNQHYREDPLTWDELDLEAKCGNDPMTWKVQHDRDAFKELWLCFENDTGRFPLYPGESTTIEYAYTVGATKWGHWLQRAVRLPTERLSVRLVFPSNLEPAVWGMETTMMAEAFPLRTAIVQSTECDFSVYDWSTESPPLHARYRLEWRFRVRDNSDGSDHTASDAMRALGVVQEGDQILARPARRFDLPLESEDARRVITELQAAVIRIAEVHTFGKGMGLAAPQIGIDRAAAIVKPPGSDGAVTLLNPRIIEQSDDADEQYEGCLSFFDVRGQVPRPLTICVEHADIDGTIRLTQFERGMARLVAHEIDHLNGMLYKDRMTADRVPIPVTEYRGSGKTWIYAPSGDVS